MSQFLAMFQQMGGDAFSQGIGQVAPYFSTIDPAITDFKPGYCELTLKNQKKVHNHLGTIHAIAMCNAAELVAGMTTDASIPKGARWIPQGMTVQYLAKAKTDLKVVCDAENVDFSQAGEVIVPVAAYDTDGNKCFSADITMNVKHAE
ncbi:phenylacetic acid degradation-like protein [Oleiphilus messinensis]|uniref:Phenylacetic acid degradation-like protein n=1 Tax=Oleiphilus messinensis TaxID=141451 RepID=A0A1Y0IB60_9GAMM|nr:hotdog fold domain-containing protein [Oleiphilus messinensis]ARU57399.1 phenylacetic acid degradation-like protein [Oleiphilus messinensis]